jgi:hypothetical protein
MVLVGVEDATRSDSSESRRARGKKAADVTELLCDVERPLEYVAFPGPLAASTGARKYVRRAVKELP